MPGGRLVFYRGVWCVYWREAGRPRRRSLGTADRTRAEQALSVYLREEQRLSRNTFTIEDLWEQQRLSLHDRPVAKTMRYSWRFLGPHIGRLTADTLTQAHIDAYVQERRAQGRADGTIWTELGYLQTVLNRAARLGLIDRALRIERPQQPPSREFYLTRPQFQQFLDACTLPHVRLFAVLAMTTGARAGALLDLTWSRVDFEKGLINFRVAGAQRKAKRRTIVPMNNSARAALLEAQAGAQTSHVIEWAGQRVGSIKKAVQAAGVRASLPVSPHVFRHSAAVWLAEDGHSMEAIAQFLGHSDSRVTEKHYARFSPEYQRAQAASLELPILSIRRAGGGCRD